MQQSKAYVIKNATRNLRSIACDAKATIAKRKASAALARDEYAAYRYGTHNARRITLAHACVLAQGGQHNGH